MIVTVVKLVTVSMQPECPSLFHQRIIHAAAVNESFGTSKKIIFFLNNYFHTYKYFPGPCMLVSSILRKSSADSRRDSQGLGTLRFSGIKCLKPGN